MAAVIGKWRNITGRRITNPADTLTFIVEAYAGANPSAENGMAGVLFILSDSGGNQLPVPVTTRGIWFPYYSEFTESQLPGVPSGMSPIPASYGFSIPVSALPFGTIRCSAKAIANNGAEYLLPDTVTVFNDSDGGDRRPSNKVLYVAATGGNDLNPGTIGQPLATMQKAATLAVKNRTTANTVFADADAGGAEIILLDGTHIWGNNANYDLFYEYWHTSDDWWLTIKSLTGNATIIRITDPSSLGDTLYPQSALFAYGWRASPTSAWLGNVNIRLANVKIEGAGAVRTANPNIKFWLDGGESYSISPRITNHTVLYAAAYARNGNLPSVEGNVGKRIASGHYRHHCAGGWYDWTQVIDCKLEYTIAISLLWSSDTQGGDLTNLFLDDCHCYDNPGGTGITDGYVWVADGSKLSVSIPSPGLMRVDSTGTLGTLPNDFRSITTNGFAAQFNHIISGNATLQTDNIRIGFRNFPSAGNNGVFKLVSAGVNGNGTEYVVCENPSAVAQVGVGGAPGSTSEMFTAVQRFSRQWNDAVHPDILQIYGATSNYIVSNIMVRNYMDSQSWFLSAGDSVNGWFVNLGDGGRGDRATIVANMAGIGLTDCGFINCTFTGDFQFGGSSTANKVNTSFVDNVFRLSSQTPPHGVSPTSCYFLNNHWVVQPPTFAADAARGVNPTTGNWFNSNPKVAPFYLTPLVGNLGTGSGFLPAPASLLWPGTSSQTRGVWRNTGEYSYQNMSAGSGPITANASIQTITIAQLAASALVPKTVTSGTQTLSISQISPLVRVRANISPSTITTALITPIEIYQSPGVEDFRSLTYDITIDGRQTYVYGHEEYSNVITSFSPTTDVGDLLISWLVFGSGRDADLVITKKSRSTGLQENITSVSIIPGNTGATWQIVGGKLNLRVPLNTRLIVVCNNDFKFGELVLHATPIRDAVPAGSVNTTVVPANFATNTKYYFPPGVYNIGVGYQINPGAQVYLEGGAVLVGTIDFTGSYDNIIQGRGMIITNNINYIDDVFPLDDSLRLPFSQLYRDPESVLPSNTVLRGVSLIASPYFGTVYAAYKHEHLTVINAWHVEGDGIIFATKSVEEPIALMDYCIVLAGDDCMHIDTQAALLINKCVFQTNNNSVLDYGYYPRPITGVARIVQDCDLSHLGATDTDIEATPGFIPPFPSRGGSAIIKGFTDGPIGSELEGFFFNGCLGIRVWGPIPSRLICLGNKSYPYSTEYQYDRIGQMAVLVFQQIWTEQVPAQISFIEGLDSVNTPRDIDLIDINIAGTQLTKANRSSYLTLNQHPYNVKIDGVPLSTHVFAPSANYISLSQNLAQVTISTNAQASVQNVSISQFSVSIRISSSTTNITLGVVISQLSAFASVFTPPNVVVQNLGLNQLSASSQVLRLANGVLQTLSINAVNQPQNTVAPGLLQSISITQRSADARSGSSTVVAAQTLNIVAITQPQPTLGFAQVQILTASQPSAVGIGTVTAPVTPITLALLPIDAYGVNPGTIVSDTLSLTFIQLTQQVRVPVIIQAARQNLDLQILDAQASGGASAQVVTQNLLLTQFFSESATSASVTNIPLVLQASSPVATIRTGQRVDAGTLVLSVLQNQAQATTSAEISISPIYLSLSTRSAVAAIVASASVAVQYLQITSPNAVGDTSVEGVAELIELFFSVEGSEGFGIIGVPSEPTIPTGDLRESLQEEIESVPVPSEEWRIVQS